MNDAPSHSAPATIEPNAIILGGRYRVDRYLGRGSFGEVYAVTYLKADERRAMKVVRRENRRAADRAQRYEARFEREFRLAAKVHDGSERDVRVLRTFELVTDADEHALYGIIELAHAGSLADELSRRVAQGKPVSIDQAVH